MELKVTSSSTHPLFSSSPQPLPPATGVYLGSEPKVGVDLGGGLGGGGLIWW